MMCERGKHGATTSLPNGYSRSVVTQIPDGNRGGGAAGLQQNDLRLITATIGNLRKDDRGRRWPVDVRNGKCRQKKVAA
jgi:hypothetical protein